MELSKELNKPSSKKITRLGCAINTLFTFQYRLLLPGRLGLVSG